MLLAVDPSMKIVISNPRRNPSTSNLFFELFGEFFDSLKLLGARFDNSSRKIWLEDECRRS